MLPLELETPAQHLFEALGGFGRGFQRRWFSASSADGAGALLGAGQFGTGANMAFRRTAFDRIAASILPAISDATAVAATWRYYRVSHL